MRLLRGRASNPQDDHNRSNKLVAEVAETGESALRVWQPHCQLAFGRRDTNRDGYDRARELVPDEIPTIERRVGGHAVFFTGTTVSFLRAEPVSDPRAGITERYETTINDLQQALAALGVKSRCGKIDGAFCPGRHSLSASGKIVGLAQRVHRSVAVVGGIVVVSDHEEIGAVLDPIYDALGVPFDPSTTGSIARAGGEADPDVVTREIEAALAVDNPTVERI